MIHQRILWVRGSARQVLYKRRPVLAVRSEAEARTAAKSLNGLFANITPPPIEATAAGSDALLHAGGITLAVIDRQASGGVDPLRYAEEWAARMGLLIRAKGTAVEGCPDCHIRRRAEVEEAARKRQRRH